MLISWQGRSASLSSSGSRRHMRRRRGIVIRRATSGPLGPLPRAGRSDLSPLRGCWLRHSPDGKRWISCRPGFFLPVRVLSRLFRRLFLESLQKAFDSGKLRFSASLEVLRDRQAFVRLLSVTCSDITASRSPKSIMPTWRRTTCAQRSGNLKANWSKDLYPILYPMAQKSRIPTP